MPIKLAPVILTTYRRLEHLKLTLDALRANSLAKDSEVYITSDGPLPGHEEDVMRAREYLKNVSGFRRVELCFYQKNDRSQIWNKRREISQLHGRYIFLEEDCVTSNFFLEALNSCLNKYEKDERMFAVLGYKPPIHHREIMNQMLSVPTFNSWGFATWNRCEILVRETLTSAEYASLLNSRRFKRTVSGSYSLLYFRMLKDIIEGRLYAFDVMARLEMMKRGMHSVLFPKTLVKNIGMDGSGEHCGTTDRFNVELEKNAGADFDIDNFIESKRLNDKFASFYGSSLSNSWRFYSKKLRGKMDL